MIRCLLAVLCLAGLAQPAWASYHFDCNSKDARTSIRGCTQAIVSGRYKPKSLARAYAQRGRAYAKIGQYQQALADITRAIAVGSREPAKPKAKYHHTRAGMYKLLNRRSEAIRDYRAALRLDPTRKNSRAALSRLERDVISRTRFDGAKRPFG